MNKDEIKELLTIETITKLEEFNQNLIIRIKKLLFKDKIEPFLIEMVLHKELYNICRTAEKKSNENEPK